MRNSERQRPALARAFALWPPHFNAPEAETVRLLGYGYSAARSHTTVVSAARVTKVVEQRGRLDILTRAGAQASKIAAMAGVPAALWGVEVNGIAPTALASLRRALGRSTRSATMGRSLTFYLALEKRLDDPYIRAAVQPIVAWAANVWTSRHPLDKMQLTICAEAARLAEATRPWAITRGPVGVLVGPHQRLPPPGGRRNHWLAQRSTSHGAIVGGGCGRRGSYGPTSGSKRPTLASGGLS